MRAIAIWILFLVPGLTSAAEEDLLAKRKALETRLKQIDQKFPPSAKTVLEELRKRAGAYFELAAKVKLYPAVGSMSYSTLLSEELLSLEAEMANQLEKMNQLDSALVPADVARASDRAVTRSYTSALERCRGAEKKWKQKGRDISFGRHCSEVTDLHRSWIAYREGWILLYREKVDAARAASIARAVTVEFSKRQSEFLSTLTFK